MSTCSRCKRVFIPDSDYARSLTVPGVCWSCLTWDEQQIETATIEAGTCDVCGDYLAGNTCCPPVYDDSEDRYADEVCQRGRPSVALSLLALWDCPHSVRALRFAYHALHRALKHGCDVLESRDVLHCDLAPL